MKGRFGNCNPGITVSGCLNCNPSRWCAGSNVRNTNIGIREQAKGAWGCPELTGRGSFGQRSADARDQADLMPQQSSDEYSRSCTEQCRLETQSIRLILNQMTVFTEGNEENGGLTSSCPVEFAEEVCDRKGGGLITPSPPTAPLRWLNHRVNSRQNSQSQTPSGCLLLSGASRLR